MSTPRRSGTVLEYPVVADIEDDASAEILVVSNTLIVGGPLEYTVQAVRDIQDRWVQGRRICNQHTYHVTNVREDGTIPQDEPKHWNLLNTFRTQAQIEGGTVCPKADPRCERSFARVQGRRRWVARGDALRMVAPWA
jgi:hypothetical protein